MAPRRVRVAAVDEIPAGQCLVVEAGDLTLAVANVDGRFYAVDNMCPHRGGPLGEGELDGTVLRCPWHGWQIDVTDGKAAQNHAVAAACFPVVVEGGAVFVVRDTP